MVGSGDKKDPTPARRVRTRPSRRRTTKKRPLKKVRGPQRTKTRRGAPADQSGEEASEESAEESAEEWHKGAGLRLDFVDRYFNHRAPRGRVAFEIIVGSLVESDVSVPAGIFRGYGFEVRYGEEFGETQRFSVDPGDPILLPPNARLSGVLDFQTMVEELPIGPVRIAFDLDGFKEFVLDSYVLPDPRTQQVVMVTDGGLITLEFLPNLKTGWVLAPNTVNNFMKLVADGFYDATTFHRIYKGFLIQGGDPTGTGRGGPGYSIPSEFNNTPHRKGIVSMARKPREPDSGGSQFFIVHGEFVQELDRLHTAFATVIDGLGTVDLLADRPVEMTKFGEKSKPREPVLLRQATLRTRPGSGTPPAEGEASESSDEEVSSETDEKAANNSEDETTGGGEPK